jgi:hypothetical protein
LWQGSHKQALSPKADAFIALTWLGGRLRSCLVWQLCGSYGGKVKAAMFAIAQVGQIDFQRPDRGRGNGMSLSRLIGA